MNTVEKIQPIINGSVNPNLTVELFAEYNEPTQRGIIWNLLVSMGARFMMILALSKSSKYDTAKRLQTHLLR